MTFCNLVVSVRNGRFLVGSLSPEESKFPYDSKSVWGNSENSHFNLWCKPKRIRSKCRHKPNFIMKAIHYKKCIKNRNSFVGKSIIAGKIFHLFGHSSLKIDVTNGLLRDLAFVYDQLLLKKLRIEWKMSKKSQKLPQVIQVVELHPWC